MYVPLMHKQVLCLTAVTIQDYICIVTTGDQPVETCPSLCSTSLSMHNTITQLFACLLPLSSSRIKYFYQKFILSKYCFICQRSLPAFESSTSPAVYNQCSGGDQFQEQSPAKTEILVTPISSRKWSWASTWAVIPIRLGLTKSVW